MRIGWLANENHFERAMSLRNGSHLPTTQCACADFAAVKKIYSCIWCTTGNPVQTSWVQYPSRTRASLHFTLIASSFEWDVTEILCTRVSSMPGQAKDHTGGKCLTYCGLSPKTAEDRITGPTWCITTEMCKKHKRECRRRRGLWECQSNRVSPSWIKWKPINKWDHVLWPRLNMTKQSSLKYTSHTHRHHTHHTHHTHHHHTHHHHHAAKLQIHKDFLFLFFLLCASLYQNCVFEHYLNLCINYYVKIKSL
jgi:hypothetical protein